MKQNKFLKQALVLLLMAVMVASSTVVVANTSTSTAAFSANKTTQTSAPLNRDLVWDNVLGVHGSRGGIIVATARTEGSAFPADDFQLDSQATVTSVAWQGGYFQCQLATGQHDYNWDWRILFWNDIGNGSWPGTLIYNQTVSDASITRSFWYNFTHENGNTYWIANYSCSLPEPITFNANTKYWITFEAIQTPNTYPQGAWCRHNSSQSPILLHEAMFQGVYWGYTNWATIMTLLVAGGDPNPLPHDLNFQLFGGAAQDTTPPVTTCTVTGTNPVTITLSATDDDSGVNHTYYKIDAGTYAIYTAPVQVSDVGDHTVYYYSTDLAGNVETEKSTDFTVEAPPLSVTIKGGLGVSVVVKNTGTSDLTNIDWSINLGGKFILVGKAKSGTIATLAAGDSVTLKDFVIGIGSTSITALVGDTETLASGTVLLIFVTGVA
jgi:hypothetical protein